MQARATLFFFSHFVAHLLSKVAARHGCEVLRTMVAWVSAVLKVAVGGSEHTRNCFTRPIVSRELSQNCKVANVTFCVRIVSTSVAQENQRAPLLLVLPFHSSHLRHSTPMQLHSAKAHRRSDCLPGAQNILKMFVAFVAVHGQHGWVLLGTEPQPASLIVRTTLLSCFHPPRRSTLPSDLNFVALSIEAPECRH